MKYKIFKLIQPDNINRLEANGFYTSQTTLTVLEAVKWPIESEHSTFESALNEIKSNSKSLKNVELTIIPIIKVDYEGDIIIEESNTPDQDDLHGLWNGDMM